MKRLLLAFLFATVAARAQNLSATITEDTKMEFTKGKGGIVLRAGTTVDVVGKDGASLTVVYRKIQGRVPAAKTDFKGDVPEAAAETPKSEPKAAPAPQSPPTQAKPADPKPAAPAGPNAPTTNYGKMVKKAKDNAAKNKETLVDPANEVTDSPKK